MSTSFNSASIAKSLGGHRSGKGYLVRCPAPGHGRGRGDRNASLLVSDGDTRLLVHCFAGCDSHDVLAELRRRGLLHEQGPQRLFGSSQSPPRTSPVGVPDIPGLWASTIPLVGSLAERYLTHHRGMTGPLPTSLRFAERASVLRPGRGYPAMVAAVQGPDDVVSAVQMTFLQQDGRKASMAFPRMTFGVLGRGTVRLGTARTAGLLGLAEGVEDALAAQQLTGVPCWATLGAARLHTIAVSHEVRELHVFADNDEAGRRAAERAARSYSLEGLRVVVRYPPQDAKDWAEVVKLNLTRRVA